jgi:hypothetical protein
MTIALPLVEPAHLWVPDHAGTYGDEVIGLWKSVGGELDPEQELAINSCAIHDKQGRWAASEVVIIEPRQNGKTSHMVVPMTLADLFLFPPGEIIHTAHRFKTTSKTFAQIKQLIDGDYSLRKRVKTILSGHGNESVELLNGAKLEVIARSQMGGRGFTGKRVDLDEAFALQDVQLDAVLPALLAQPNIQIVYASSAGLKNSSMLRSLRDRGRRMNDRGLVYIEWCAPGSFDEPGCEQRNCSHHYTSVGCSLDNEDYHSQANPARNRRIREESIETMRKSLTPRGFAREVLGWWDDPDAAALLPIDIEKWRKCRDVESKIYGAITIAFDVSPDRRTAAIAVSGRRRDGILHGEIVRYGDSTEWLVREIVRLKAEHKLLRIKVGAEQIPAIICDPAGPAASLIPDLQQAGVRVVTMTARMLGAACGGLQDVVELGPTAWRHIGQYQVDLAVENASKRDVGDGAWAFGRSLSAKSSVDICPLVALTMARWGVTVAARPVRMPRFASA